MFQFGEGLPGAGRPVALDPLLTHPLASQLLRAAQRCIQEESLGGDAAEALADMRGIALRMMGGAAR